jgi:hypothetical protein
MAVFCSPVGEVFVKLRPLCHLATKNTPGLMCESHKQLAKGASCTKIVNGRLIGY